MIRHTLCIVLLAAATGAAYADEPSNAAPARFLPLDSARANQQGAVGEAAPPARYFPLHTQRSFPVPPRPRAPISSTAKLPDTTHFGRPEHVKRLTPEQAQQLLSIFNESR